MTWIRLPVAAIIALVVGMPLSACRNCSDIGCHNLLEFRVSGLPHPQKRMPLEVEVCYDDACETTKVDQRGSRFFLEPNSNIELYATQNGPTLIEYRLPQEELDSEEEHRVSLRAERKDGWMVRDERDLVLQENDVGDPGCGPVCWSGQVDVTAVLP